MPLTNIIQSPGARVHQTAAGRGGPQRRNATLLYLLRDAALSEARPAAAAGHTRKFAQTEAVATQLAMRDMEIPRRPDKICLGWSRAARWKRIASIYTWRCCRNPRRNPGPGHHGRGRQRNSRPTDHRLSSGPSGSPSRREDGGQSRPPPPASRKGDCLELGRQMGSTATAPCRRR